jgi:hypothetical protein
VSIREGGYIKLPRGLESSPLWKSLTAVQRMVWVQLLWCANWKEDVCWYGTKSFPMKRGQLAHSEAEIARRAGVSRKVVRVTIAKLIMHGRIGREKGPLEGQAPFIVTILDYDGFNGAVEQEGPRLGYGEGPARALGGEVREVEKEAQQAESRWNPSGVELHPIPQRWPLAEKLRLELTARFAPQANGGKGLRLPNTAATLEQLERDIEHIGFDAILCEAIRYGLEKNAGANIRSLNFWTGRLNSFAQPEKVPRAAPKPEGRQLLT